MNRNEFIKLLPTGDEKVQANQHNSGFWLAGVEWALDYLKAKFPDFTEDEKFAIEYYKENKLDAVKYLMHNTGRGLKEANDFLKENQNQ